MNNQTEQVTNPIAHYKVFNGITINTNDKEATEQLQDIFKDIKKVQYDEKVKRMVAEENKKAASCWSEGKPQEGICVACGVGEV